MNLENKSTNELIVIARTTKCLIQMKFLAKYPAMNVRRSLAKNTDISQSILKELLFDPVENVSYIAQLNPNTTLKREFNNLRPCVLCDINEELLLTTCINCEKIEDHRF